jgi:hypothetical protein
MRPFSMLRLTLLALVVSGLLVPAAAAAPPVHWSLAGDENNPKPAGTLCDFNYTVRFHFEADVASFSDGREEWHWEIDGTHLNLDTGRSVSDIDRYSVTYYPDHEKDAGVFFHLRDASGKPVAVYAGQLYFSDTGVKFTPNSGGSGTAAYAAIVCPALGGQPAV